MDRERYGVPVGWMLEDVQKAIDADANFLAALGLLVYTETLGREMLRAEGTPNSNNEACFLKFMGAMGYPADVFKKAKAFDAFRHGMAHEYYIKGNSAIVATSFREGEDPSGDRPGLELHPDGTPAALVLGSYLRDFRRAAQTWATKAEAYRSGSVPMPPGGIRPDFPSQGTSAQVYPPFPPKDST